MFVRGVWPVVQRELRAAARWPLSPWLRVGSGLGAIAAFWFSSDIPYELLGVALIARVHTLLLWLICASIPAMTADCLARERREGTLGLLFLTPLTATGIVLGKISALVFRMCIVGLAVAPVLTIPFLVGGVSWSEVLALLGTEISAAMLCLAAGVLASSMTDNRALAIIFAFLLASAFLFGAALVGDAYLSSTTATLSPGSTTSRLTEMFGTGLAMSFLETGSMLEDLTLSSLLLLAALRFAGWRVQRSWRDQIPSARRQNLLRRYCTPVLKRWFARSMRRALERNPIAWLQQYSWKARVTKWGLCLLVLMAESEVVSGNAYFNGESHFMIIILLLVAAAYLFAGVNGFFREKKSGALELILVSPLSIKQIIFGRVRGLWRQFFPGVFLLLAADVFLRATIPDQNLFFYNTRTGGDMEWDNSWMLDLEIAAIFLTLPVVATCFALIFRNLLVVSALTAAVVFGPAAALIFHDYLVAALFSQAPNGSFMFGLGTLLDMFPPVALCVMTVHAGTVWFSYIRLRRNLGRRNYSF